MSLFPGNPDEIGDDEHGLLMLLQSASMSDALTDWEHEFCESMHNRLIEWGKRTRVSERQQEVLDRIEAKLNNEF